MDIFDAHTHFLSREYYEFQTARQPDGTEEIVLKQTEESGPGAPPDDSAGRLGGVLDDMDACGVARAVTYAAVPQEMEVVGRTALRSNDRLIPYAAVNPASPASLELLRSLQPRYRFRGLVLFPVMHSYSIDGDRAANALDYARSNRMVVLVHYGWLPVGIRTLIGLDPELPPDRGHPSDLMPVARARQDQHFVAPCPGASFFEEFLELGISCPNVYADTAGSVSWVDADRQPSALANMFERMRRAYGVERILFGSDSGGFPPGYRTDIRDAQCSAMVAAGFTEGERTAVLGLNLSRLLGTPL